MSLQVKCGNGLSQFLSVCKSQSSKFTPQKLLSCKYFLKIPTFQNMFVSSIVITKYFYCGLFNDRVTFKAFLAFVGEGMLCKGQMELLRCVFVVSICVDSKSGGTCWLWKGNCSEGHCNVESILFLGHGLHDQVDAFDLKKICCMCEVVSIK